MNKFKWFKKRISWNYKYKMGKWDFMEDEKIRYSAIIELIKETNIKKPKLLDLGCGFGSLNHYLNENEFSACLGIDLSSVAINKAKKRKYINSEFITADIHDFYPKEKYDIIIFNEVLYYLDNQMEIVSRFSNYTNSPSYFIFSFYGVREDLIDELEKKYKLIKRELITHPKEKLFWGICLYQI